MKALTPGQRLKEAFWSSACCCQVLCSRADCSTRCTLSCSTRWPQQLCQLAGGKAPCHIICHNRSWPPQIPALEQVLHVGRLDMGCHGRRAGPTGAESPGSCSCPSSAGNCARIASFSHATLPRCLLPQHQQADYQPPRSVLTTQFRRCAALTPILASFHLVFQRPLSHRARILWPQLDTQALPAILVIRLRRGI